MKSKVWTILLSVFVAFGLWMYVTTVEHTQIEMTFYNIPVNWAGEEVMNDRDLQLVDRNMTISMKLYGNRSVLNKMKSSDIVVLADLSHITEAGEKHLDYSVNYSGVANNSIDIVDKPASINVQVAQWKDIAVNVEVVIEGEDALKDTGIGGIKYVINGDGVAKPVNISGPIEVVNRVSKAQVTVNMAGKDATVEEQMTVTLFDADGNQIVDDRIYKENTLVTVPVAAEKTIQLVIPVDPGDLLLAGDPKPVFSVVKDGIAEHITEVTVRGPLKAVQLVNAENILGNKKIVLKNDVKEYEETIALNLPAEVRCVQGTAVTVRLDIPWLLNIPFGLNQVTLGKGFENYTVTFGSDHVKIAYFGKTRITTDHVTVTLLFDNAQVNNQNGNFRYEVKISIDGKTYQFAGADLVTKAYAKERVLPKEVIW